jgi:DNA polymerase III subunit delta
VSATVHLVRGDDAALVGAAVSEVVHRLVGQGDRELMVEELVGDDYELGAVVDAALTPPFLTERRIVVARNLRRFLPSRATAAEGPADEEDDDDDEPAVAPAAGVLAPLLAYLASPLPSTDLILEVWKRATPRALLDAVKRAGGALVETNVKAGKERLVWLEEHLRGASVNIDQEARGAIGLHVGEDLARIAPLLELLESTFGPGAHIGLPEVRPFLGEAGGVPPWDLTDAIDAGHTRQALTLAARMLGGGERHPLQVMAILHSHYTRLLRLDGSGLRGEADVAALLKVAPFQAKRIVATSHRLGHDGVSQAIGLLAQADRDLRGERDLPEDVVMEVLVARLSRLVPPPKGGRR